MSQLLLVSRTASLVVIALLLGLVAATPARAEFDVLGTWFVLAHYRDSMTANPDADRWEDRVWLIEKSGSRLKWTDYPIVVFNDGSGRFAPLGGNPRARVLDKWEPNDSQMREIKQGPQVNSRGSKTKTLRGSAKRGYKTSGSLRTASAFTVGYQETWSIEDPTGVPTFIRDDSVGTEASLATSGESVVSGRTLYKGLEVSADGNVISGSYARDDNKLGSFRLIRAGHPRGVETDGRTPNEKAADRAREQFQAAAREEGYKGFLQSLDDEQARDLRAQIGEDALRAIWDKYEQRILSGDQRGDQSARRELANELRDAYIESVERDLEKSLLEGGIDPWLARTGEAGAEVDPKQLELVERVRDQLGEEKLVALLAKYGDRIRAGDEEARQAFRDEVGKAYRASLEEAFMKRLNAGDAEAVRQMREAQRRERDRR
jgi:hypothetical protein